MLSPLYIASAQTAEEILRSLSLSASSRNFQKMTADPLGYVGHTPLEASALRIPGLYPLDILGHFNIPSTAPSYTSLAVSLLPACLAFQ